MIKYIHIENFKSIKRLSMAMGQLNLLFGMNGMGKSSVIQTILLCRQSYWLSGRTNMDHLYVNGDLVELGTAKEILCTNADDDRIRLEYHYEDNDAFDFVYMFDQNDIHSNRLKRMGAINEKGYTTSIFGNDFSYLTAEHLGPRRKYDYTKWVDSGINKIGIHGEYAVPFLAMNGDSYIVPKELCIETGRTDHLIDQVSAWMDKISSGVRLNAELIAGDQEARLNISYDELRLVSSSYSPVNVGFGIPYVLPVIVAMLTASKDSLILVENPESHLHPRGQTSMAELMSKAANYGAQIICESHSDHIINGVRVAVKENMISKDDVSVIYFTKNKNLNSIGTSLSIDAKGNLDEYPEGLLDEWGDLMARLI